jgi:hypothetical protein
VVDPASTAVGPMRLERPIAGSRRALLGALAGDDKGAPVLEPCLAPDGSGQDVDLQCRAAPAHREVRRHLGESTPHARRPVSAGAAKAAARLLEQDRGGRHAVPGHLLAKAAVAPGVEETKAEMVGERRHIGRGNRPVHQDPPPAIDQVMVQLDRCRRHAEIEQVEQGRQAVLAAAEGDHDLVVGTGVHGAHGRPSRPS